jgi:hypothetical protein
MKRDDWQKLHNINQLEYTNQLSLHWSFIQIEYIWTTIIVCYDFYF